MINATNAMHPSTASAALAHVREKVWSWTNEWGPTVNWRYRVAAEIEEAEEDGTLEEWEGQALAFAKLGRAILDELRALPTLQLPTNTLEIRDVMMQAFDLMRELHERIASLEARLPVKN